MPERTAAEVEANYSPEPLDTELTALPTGEYEALRSERDEYLVKLGFKDREIATLQKALEREKASRKKLYMDKFLPLLAEFQTTKQINTELSREGIELRRIVSEHVLAKVNEATPQTPPVTEAQADGDTGWMDPANGESVELSGGVRPPGYSSKSPPSALNADEAGVYTSPHKVDCTYQTGGKCNCVPLEQQVLPGTPMPAKHKDG